MSEERDEKKNCAWRTEKPKREERKSARADACVP